MSVCLPAAWKSAMPSKGVRHGVAAHRRSNGLDAAIAPRGFSERFRLVVKSFVVVGNVQKPITQLIKTPYKTFSFILSPQQPIAKHRRL